MFNKITTILEKYYNFIAVEKNFRNELQFMKRIAIQQKITITGRITNIEKYYNCRKVRREVVDSMRLLMKLAKERNPQG